MATKLSQIFAPTPPPKVGVGSILLQHKTGNHYLVASQLGERSFVLVSLTGHVMHGRAVPLDERAFSNTEVMQLLSGFSERGLDNFSLVTLQEAAAGKEST